MISDYNRDPSRFPARDFHFPESFSFGVATAAHQVEGNNTLSDWWDFEQIPGNIADGTRSGEACQHYTRFREDIRLISDLHLTAYRFSVEWARVEPEPGRFDSAVLDHYMEVVDACWEAGVTPIVTLHHFTLPRWFAARGGWLAPDAPGIFARYGQAVVDRLGGRVPRWITLNEPGVAVFHGYGVGLWPPQKKNMGLLIRASRNLIRAHLEAYRVLKAHPSSRRSSPGVGIAHHLRIFDPARGDSRLDALAARAQDIAFNRAWIDTVGSGRFCPPFGVGEAIPGWIPCQDFFGMNYYTRGKVRFSLRLPGQLFGEQTTPPGVPVSDLGWEIYPEGLGRLLQEVHRRTGLPIWITENGIADRDDSRRPLYLVQHLAQIAMALEAGIPIEGYLHWSLYDNFEWAEGFTPRFGLYAVDYTTQKRTLRPSGALYGRIAEGRSLTAQQLPEPSMIKK